MHRHLLGIQVNLPDFVENRKWGHIETANGTKSWILKKKNAMVFPKSAIWVPF